MSSAIDFLSGFYALPQKSGEVLCYTARNLECLSGHTNGHMLGTFYTIPFIP